ncbi:Myo20 [Bugula neritina]|uniref:Myo20 n=1 Tax=Bugula neritina TaxID=10212 RepID=A0A7J7JY70_BUGNE|nr:Myo20 [Bugula neritina]
MLAASAMAGEELYYHGKNYIMSLFMESIYMHQKYWQHLKHIDLDKERTFRHLRCLEEYVIKTDRKLRNLRPSMEEDLCQLPGPITEESVCRHLYHRFERHQYHTFLGSTLIALNPHTHRLPYKALHCNKGLSRNLRLLVTKVLHQVAELRQSHSVVVSGETGSGKTRTFMELLRHLYDQAGGGQETDTFKVISAAVTALRPFDTTATIANQESSRSCWSVECAVSNRAIASAHLTLHSLSYNRLTGRPTVERCYDVFYMILAGMSEEEKAKTLCFEVPPFWTEYRVLAYLSSLDVLRKSTSSRRYREKYTLWKEALAMLGIPHTEILEILSAILLLGNIVFVQGEEQELAVTGNSPLHSAAKLLKIPADKLLRCLTTQLVPVRGKSALFTNTIQQANTRRNTLAQSLYGRLFQYLVNKINQSTESRAAHPRASSQSGNHHSGSSVTNTVNVIDCIGFQNVQGTQLEHYAETSALKQYSTFIT